MFGIRSLFVSASVLAVRAANPAHAQDTSTIQVPVRLVTVPTLVVSESGKFIPDLKIADFRLTEDGQLRKVNLDTDALPLSVAVAVQIDHDVRTYLPFISRVGSILDDSLAAVTGETSLIAYNDSVELIKPFGDSDLRSAMRKLSPAGRGAHMVDAGLLALEMLRARKGPRSRILLYIGQPFESGSTRKLAALESEAERDNVQIYALKLPIYGAAFVSDTFRLEGLGSQAYRGGYQASVELTRAVPALQHAAQAAAGTDPYSLLTGLTGGFVMHFRKQRELEDAIMLMGEALRSRYLLSFSPSANDTNPHQIGVQVSRPGAKIYARSQYRLTTQ
jgi:VWFA-related protein